MSDKELYEWLFTTDMDEIIDCDFSSAEKKGMIQMREILFRGKRKDNGEWVYGYYFVTWSCRNGIRKDLHQIHNYYLDESFEVIPETIGQFIGLTDKNGTKIFEGDIVSDGEFIGEVHYNPILASFMVKINDSTEEYYHYGHFNEDNPSRKQQLQYTEIIGNTTDNPELLKE